MGEEKVLNFHILNYPYNAANNGVSRQLARVLSTQNLRVLMYLEGDTGVKRGAGKPE